MKTRIVFAAIVFAVAGSAAAQTATPADAHTAEPEAVHAAKPDSDKIRCKRMPSTGSRVGKSVCHTEAQWAAMEESADGFMRDLEGVPRRDRSMDGGGSGGRGIGSGNSNDGGGL